MAVYDINGHNIAGGDLAGKKIATFGDSITWYDGHSQSSTTVNGYQYYMRNAGMTVTNLGVDGAKLALREGTQVDIVESVAATDCSQFDYIMIAGGTNDYGGGGPRPLGELHIRHVNGLWRAADDDRENLYGQKEHQIIFRYPTSAHGYDRCKQSKPGAGRLLRGDPTGRSPIRGTSARLPAHERP